MGSNSKTRKSVKEAEKEKKKKKIMAVASPEVKSHSEKKKKKLSKKTLKPTTQGNESTKEKKKNKLSGKKKKGKEDRGTEDDAVGGANLQAEPKSDIKSESSKEIEVLDKSEKSGKKRKTQQLLSKKSNKLKKMSEPVADEVYHISSGDEDCSRGMKKWVTEYHQNRPGLEILQEKIDEFISAHEEREEQERKEREARVAEGGWTVVQHHKGRKKTTDSESGITVGSVAQAAVIDKMAKKKNKEVGIDFYRFQRREARMNEVMMLQSKFEQDRKRIQQLRAARKFRPY